MITVLPENTDAVGRFFAVTRTMLDDGTVTSVIRRPIAPGRWEVEGGAAAFVATDLSEESPVIQAFAQTLWTPETVEAFKTLTAPQPGIVTAQDVATERERRLGLGFDYDFGGERGVRHIGTTPADMIGWQDVTTIAAAMLATGIAQPIMIDTDGDGEPIAVTATEWQHVLLAAAAFRQPIWLGSFALMKMDPIPADYASNEAYWAGQ